MGGGGVLKRLFDAVGAALLLLLLAGVFAAVAIAIKIDSRGPVFFRSRRVGLNGREFGMLKFRKMVDGAGGPPLTDADDPRFTRVGRRLSRSKLDELPQIWNVLKGQMSLVGPRPEDPAFVDLWRDEHPAILRVRPGMTGLSQLAFAREAEVLDPNDRVRDYIERVAPQKVALDDLYAEHHNLRKDMGILGWTTLVVLFDRDVAVHRVTGKLNVRRRPELERALDQRQTRDQRQTEVEA
jgi:lipopolysaccharide/colanic/teichoic acid biosynthesis glycosyltransferase